MSNLEKNVIRTILCSIVAKNGHTVQKCNKCVKKCNKCGYWLFLR